MAPKQKHIPTRTCVICRQAKEKRGLTRLVRTPEEVVLIDPTGKANGRGAYLCDDPACWEKASRSKDLETALKAPLTKDERAMIAAHAEKIRGNTKPPQTV